MEVRTDLSIFLPDTRTAAQELLVNQLREGPTTHIVLAALDGADTSALAQTSRAMAERLRTNPDILAVVNGPESLSDRERQLLFDNRYLLMPADVAFGLETKDLRAALEQALTRLRSSLGMIERRFVERDPTGEWRRLFGAGASAGNVSLRDGVWFSASGKRALLLLRTRAPAFDLDAQERVLGDIRAAFDAAAAKGVHLMLTGPGVFAVASSQAIQEDAWSLSTIGNVAVILLLLYVFRSLRPVGISMLPLVSGVLAGMAVVTLVYGSIHGITLAFGVTLTGIAADYPLHVMIHRRDKEVAELTTERIWPTLWLGIVTTAIAYAVLLFADLRGLAQLGWLSTVAIIVAGAVTRWVVPPLATPVEVRSLTADRYLLPAMDVLASLRTPTWIAVALSVIYVGWHAAEFWQNDLAELSPVPQQAKEDDRLLRADLGTADPRHVVLAVGADPQQALERCEAVTRRIDSALNDKILAGYEAPCRYLPSVAAQRARQARIPNAATIRTRLHEAAKGLPFKSDLFEPFVADLTQTRLHAPITPSDLQGTLMGARLETLLFSQGSRWVATIPMREVRDPTALAKAINADNEQIFYLDLKRESEQMVTSYRDRALVLWSAGLVGIILTLWFSLRSLRQALEMMIPVAASVVIICAMLLLAGQRISLFHLISLLLVVGIGLDYLLFFNRPEADELERLHSAKAVLFCALTTVFAFGVLAVSRIPVLAAIGSTVALGSVVCFVLAAAFSRPPSVTRAEPIKEVSVA